MTLLPYVLFGVTLFYLTCVLYINYQQYTLLGKGQAALVPQLYAQLQPHFAQKEFALHVQDAQKRVKHRCYQACAWCAMMLASALLLWLFQSKTLLQYGFFDAVAWLNHPAVLILAPVLFIMYQAKQNKRTPVEFGVTTAYKQHSHHATQVIDMLVFAGYTDNELRVADALGWNATFVHVGKHKGVTLGSQLVSRLDGNEQVAVVAHELGHRYEKHPMWLASFRVVADGMFLVGCLLWSVGTAHAGLPASISLLLLCAYLPAYRFFVAPLYNMLARYCERRADNWAVRTTSSTGLLSALRLIYAYAPRHLATCRLFYWFYFSHPMADERLQHLSLMNE